MARTLPVLVLLMQTVAFGAAAQDRIEPEPLPPLPPSREAPRGAPPEAPGELTREAPPWDLPPRDAAPSDRFTPPPPGRSPIPLGSRGLPTEPGPPTPPEPGVAETAPPDTARVFCDQSISFHLADRATTPERFRPFVGIWSDASWTPQVCAALIVEKVGSDGLASIIYAFGPMGSNARVKGGVLHGTGVVRNGELLFQNADGSQYAFRPLYADLEGRFTTPQGQTYQAIFKKTF